MRAKEQLSISVNGIMVEQEVWLTDIVEPLILGLDILAQLEATVDTASKLQHVSARASSVQANAVVNRAYVESHPARQGR